MIRAWVHLGERVDRLLGKLGLAVNEVVRRLIERI
jgi:hypothetical protein